MNKIWSLFFKPCGVDENIEEVVINAHIRYKTYKKLADASKVSVVGKKDVKKSAQTHYSFHHRYTAACKE